MRITVTLALYLTLAVSVASCKKEESTIKADAISKPIANEEKVPSKSIVNQIIEAKLNLLKQLKSNSSDANALYVAFRNQTDTLVDQLNSDEEKLLESYQTLTYDEKSEKVIIPDSLKTKVSLIENAALEIWGIGEGFFEIRTKPNYYYAIFKEYVSPDYKEYLKLEAEENEVLWEADAGVIISWKDLSARVLHWDRFLTKYPASPLFKEGRESYQSYLVAYLLGSDNSPVITDDGKDIYPDIKEEFNRFILENPETNTTKVIRVYLENWSKMEIGKLYDFIEKEQRQYFIQNNKQI